MIEALSHDPETRVREFAQNRIVIFVQDISHCSIMVNMFYLLNFLFSKLCSTSTGVGLDTHNLAVSVVNALFF